MDESGEYNDVPRSVYLSRIIFMGGKIRQPVVLYVRVCVFHVTPTTGICYFHSI